MILISDHSIMLKVDASKLCLFVRGRTSPDTALQVAYISIQNNRFNVNFRYKAVEFIAVVKRHLRIYAFVHSCSLLFTDFTLIVGTRYFVRAFSNKTNLCTRCFPIVCLFLIKFVIMYVSNAQSWRNPYQNAAAAAIHFFIQEFLRHSASHHYE